MLYKIVSDFFRNFTIRVKGPGAVMFASGCFLSTCAITNLVNDMSMGGDESAGQSSSNPFGPGK